MGKVCTFIISRSLLFLYRILYLYIKCSWNWILLRKILSVLLLINSFYVILIVFIVINNCNQTSSNVQLRQWLRCVCTARFDLTLRYIIARILDSLIASAARICFFFPAMQNPSAAQYRKRRERRRQVVRKIFSRPGSGRSWKLVTWLAIVQPSRAYASRK